VSPVGRENPGGDPSAIWGHEVTRMVKLPRIGIPLPGQARLPLLFSVRG